MNHLELYQQGVALLRQAQEELTREAAAGEVHPRFASDFRRAVSVVGGFGPELDRVRGFRRVIPEATPPPPPPPPPPPQSKYEPPIQTLKESVDDGLESMAYGIVMQLSAPREEDTPEITAVSSLLHSDPERFIKAIVDAHNQLTTRISGAEDALNLPEGEVRRLSEARAIPSSRRGTQRVFTVYDLYAGAIAREILTTNPETALADLDFYVSPLHQLGAFKAEYSTPNVFDSPML